MPLETFHVPRQVFAPKAGLGSYERLFLVSLLHFWEQGGTPEMRIFRVSNMDLVRASGISWRAIPAVRRRLVEKGLISAVPGCAGKMTEYAIHWDRIAAIGATAQ